MQLVINTRGAYIKKKGNCFEVKNDDKVFEVSNKKVESILITTSATITTDAIKMAVDNNIDIIFLDHFGNPYGRVWHGKLGSTTLIRRRQLEMYDNEAGLKLAKSWIIQKINEQIELLKRLAKNRPEKRELLKTKVEKIKYLKEQIDNLSGKIEDKRQLILGFEGMSSRTYFEAISEILPVKFKFEERSRMPAKNEFNCLLNYGYGVLYSMIEKACIIAGLDPYIGFMHTDNYNKKSFVFDIIEPFRIHIDQTIVNLFSKRQIKEKYFDKIKNGLTLNKNGKAVLIQALNDTFEKPISYHDRNIKIKNVIQLECHRIANHLIK